ncbi:MAG TPA: MBL fold metallo-hydrolase [Chitinophagaceae bacterium]|nr:MBL fold metallo-hydrolase [Chitinophagaceae bacterium]
MEFTFHWIGGATFILGIGNLKIAVDPVLCEKGTIHDYFWFKSKRLEEPIYEENDFENIDLWLITHNHKDHLDKKGLSKIADSSKIICNQNSSGILKQNGKTDLTILNWKQSKEYTIKDHNITIEAIPAIHGVNPVSAWLAGKGNGYYLTASNEKEKISIYLTGDTVYKNSIIKYMENKPIDLLIPNMGAAKEGSWIMTLTLNSKMLAKMISRLDPSIIIPVHYGTFEHYKEPVEKIKAIADERIKILEVGSKTKWT